MSAVVVLARPPWPGAVLTMSNLSYEPLHLHLHLHIYKSPPPRPILLCFFIKGPDEAALKILRGLQAQIPKRAKTFLENEFVQFLMS